MPTDNDIGRRMRFSDKDCRGMTFKTSFLRRGLRDMNASHRLANRRLGIIADAGRLTPLDQLGPFVAALRTHLRQADV
jgi:hypothetical protein